MTCETCDGFGYLLTAPATYQEGGEMRSCPVCTAAPNNTASVTAARNLPDFWMVDELRRRGWSVREGVGVDRYANDEAAKALYDSWSNQPGWVPWVERGNSTMQDKARASIVDLAPKVASDTGAGLDRDHREGIVKRAVERIMGGFSFATLEGPENLRARLSMCARQAVEDTVAALATDATDGATGGGESVAWCSPGQLANLTDVDADGGVYLPIRKTKRGNFTMPLYATTPGGDLLEQAARERQQVVAWLRAQSEAGADIGIAAEKGTTRRAAYGGGSLALKRAADAVEAGEHSARNQTDDGGEK